MAKKDEVQPSVEIYDDEKTAFLREFEKMRPDLVYTEGWTDEQKTQAAEVLRPTRVKTGMLSSIPMTCRSSECPVAASCPLYEKGIEPKGEKCPIETALIMELFNSYVEELGVDVTRIVEFAIVRDLVDQEIQHMRKTWVLSQEHFIQENVVGIDAQGNVVTQKGLHSAVEYEEKLLKRKEKLRNALLATRESKAKTGQSTADSAQVIAGILQQHRALEQEKQKELMRKLGLEEHDEYIEDAEVIEETPPDKEE